MPETPKEPESEAPAETEIPLATAAEILADMTLPQKIGQLFIVRPDALVQAPKKKGRATSLTEDMTAALEKYPVGGFVQFGGNITGPDQIRIFNADLSRACGIAPFLAVDEEGGAVSRLANKKSFGLPLYESAAAVGAQGPEAALEMGRTIGAYLRRYGFNMDFAPVADTFTNPDNTVIGTRAFSDDPDRVALCAGAMADGLRENGILPVFKHFPGHGDTAEDSHKKLAVSRKTLDELMECEWVPFLRAGPGDCIMSAHIALPEVTGDMTPSTMNAKVIQGCLREKLGYQGLVITDALGMGAVSDSYSPAEAAASALKAGCDMLLMPASLPEAFEGVAAAVEDGSFPPEELDRTVMRILDVKIQQGIIAG